MANKRAAPKKQQGPSSKRNLARSNPTIHSALGASDRAVIASLRQISPAQAAEIVRRAGIVDAAGRLNPIFGG